MTRVRAVTAVLTGLTVLAVVAGIVTAVKLPAGSWLVWFLVAVLIGAINAGLAVFVAWKAADNWCAAVLALAGCWMCASATVRRVASGFLDRISTAEPLGDRADSRHLDALLPAAGLADVDLSDGPGADVPLAGGSDRPAGSRRDLQPDERDGTWSLRRSIP
jgi:hypothetical protein